MSDFGCTIIVTPINDIINAETAVRLLQIIEEEYLSGDYSDIFKEDEENFSYVLRDNDIMIILYSLYEGLGDEDIEFAKEETMPDAELMAQKLNVDNPYFSYRASWEIW